MVNTVSTNANAYVVDGTADNTSETAGVFFLESAQARDDLTPLINMPSTNAFIGGDASVVIQEPASKCSASTSWLIDSGATHHSTHNAAAILSSSPSLLRISVAKRSVL